MNLSNFRKQYSPIPRSKKKSFLTKEQVKATNKMYKTKFTTKNTEAEVLKVLRRLAILTIGGSLTLQ